MAAPLHCRLVGYVEPCVGQKCGPLQREAFGPEESQILIRGWKEWRRRLLEGFSCLHHLAFYPCLGVHLSLALLFFSVALPLSLFVFCGLAFLHPLLSVCFPFPPYSHLLFLFLYPPRRPHHLRQGRKTWTFDPSATFQYASPNCCCGA